jgi:hypothetical protein
VSSGKTAQRDADSPGEGFGLDFLFASFSLDSKEKEGESFQTFNINQDEGDPYFFKSLSIFSE